MDVCFAVSERVMLRKTSSSRPSSVWTSSSLPCAGGNEDVSRQVAVCDFRSWDKCAPRLCRAFLFDDGGPPRVGDARKADIFDQFADPPHPAPPGARLRQYRDCCFRPCCGVPLATIWPRSIIICAAEQTASTSSRICVEKMIAFRSPIRLIKPRTSCFWLGSRAVGRLVQD